MSPAAGVAEAITALTAEVASLGTSVKDMKEDVVEIRKQTTATNGRVNGLEARETARAEVSAALAAERATAATSVTLRQRHREWLVGTLVAIGTCLVTVAATHLP